MYIIYHKVYKWEKKRKTANILKKELGNYKKNDKEQSKQ